MGSKGNMIEEKGFHGCLRQRGYSVNTCWINAQRKEDVGNA